MQFRTTAILLIVCVVLGGYLFWSNRNQPANPTPTTETTIPVLRLNATDVGLVAIQDASGTQVRVERNANAWRLTAPSPGPADSTQVTDVVNQLANLQATRTITPTGQNLAPYGLDKPAYQVQLLRGNTTLGTLHVGNKNPSGDATYVQHVGNPIIYLVNSSTLDKLEQWVKTPPVQPTPIPVASATAPAATAIPSAAATPETVPTAVPSATVPAESPAPSSAPPTTSATPAS